VHVTRWIWVGPIAFLVHDAEELLTFAPWLATHGSRLPSIAQPLLGGVTTARFAVSVLVLFVGFVAASAHGAWAARHGRRSWPWLIVAGAFVANGVTHVAQGVWFAGYVPGLATALGVSLPYGWMAARAYRRAGLASTAMLGAAGALGLVLQAPLALAALAAGGALR